MPKGIIKAVAKAAVVGASVGFAVATGGLGTPLAIGIGAGAFGLGLASEAIKPKPTAKEPDFARADFDTSFPIEARQRTQMIRSSIAPYRVIYGEVITSGTLVAAFSTGINKEFLHLVIALTGHQVNSISDVWLDDVLSTDARFTGLVRINKYLGTDTQVADPDLLAEVSQWTTNHRLRGIAYIYIRLKWDEKVWIKGIPNIKAKIQGRLVFDPRTNTTVYSNNAVLCQRDYLVSDFGFGAAIAELDETSFVAAANVCDEDVALPVGTQKRYTCDGSFTLDKILKDVMEGLLTASAGTLVYPGGRYKCFAGSWLTPTVTLDEDDLRGPIQFKTKPSRKDLYNAVKGTFINKAENYLPTDFPPMLNAQYETDDGSIRIYKDIELPYTDDATRAQRIAKIHLERSRQGVVVVFPAKLTAFELSIWDTVYINNTKLGWNQKTFRITDWSLSDDGGVDLVLQEDSASAWGWVSGDAKTFTPPTAPTLPDPYTVSAPIGVTISSGASELLQLGDGTVISRIKVAWTTSTNQLVLSGGRHEIQWKKNADATYINTAFAPGNVNTAFLSSVLDGTAYDIRIRATNNAGVSSAWTEVLNHTVIGKTGLPAIPTGLIATPFVTSIVLAWTANADTDIAGYEIQRADDAGFTVGIVNISRPLSTSYVDALNGRGIQKFYKIRALNRSGNFSSYSVVVNATTPGVGPNELKVDVAVITVAAQIANALIGTAHIVDLSVGTAKIADGAITNAKIANLSVDAAKIVDGNINTAKIQDLAVNSAKIGDLQVGTIKIANNAVTSDVAFSNDAALNFSINVETELGTITLSTNGGSAVVWGKLRAFGGGTGSFTMRIRKDSITGAVLDIGTFFAGDTVTLIGHDTAPAATQTYKLTLIHNDSGTAGGELRRMVGINLKK